MSALCAEFGISRKTGYKLYERYRDCGARAFADRSRRPYRHANQLPLVIEKWIVGLKKEYPEWGAPKIRERLRVRYPDVQRHLAERGVAHPSLGQVRQSVVEIRRRKSMVLDAADPNARSVGSFFMNPVVSDATCAAVQERAARMRAPGAAEMPRWPVAGGRVKLSAAWLIERAGFRRGYREGYGPR